ncbi:hypothetical protein HMI54_006070, partial [Coelomomyces lativittatus]
AELQSSQGFKVPSSGKDSAEDEARREQAEEMRKTMLLSLLDNDARERLARIAIVKPPRARSVEDMLIRMAQQGQIRQKVTDEHLVSLLENISEAKAETKIVFNRRKTQESDDEEEWNL